MIFQPHPFVSTLHTPLDLSLFSCFLFYHLIWTFSDGIFEKKSRRSTCFFALGEEGSGRSSSEASAELVSEVKADDDTKVDDGGRSIGESQRSGSIEKSMIKSSVRRLGLDTG